MPRIYKTMQGREVDMEALLTRNETMPAVGNVRVNARGDELGPDGKIVRTREDILSEYYENDPTSISDDELSLSKVKINSNRKTFTTEDLEREEAAKEAAAKEREAKAKAKEAK